MLKSAAALALSLLAAAAPAQARPPHSFAPAKLRVARAGDMRPHPGAEYEAWMLRAIDPRTHYRLSLLIKRVPEEQIVYATAIKPGTAQSWVQTAIEWDPELGAGRTWKTPRDSLTIAPHGARRWEVVGTGESIEGQLHIRAARPGAYAARWRYGSDSYDGEQDVSWAQPVATGVARGRLAVRSWDESTSLRLHRWRVSIEHWWGQSGERANSWGSWIAHEPRGAAWSLAGADWIDQSVGPGVHDENWAGVLTRVDDGHTRVCRPRITRYPTGNSEPDFPVRPWIRARCAGMRVRLRHVPAVEKFDSEVEAGHGIGTLFALPPTWLVNPSP